MSRRINIKDEYQNKFYQLPKVFFTSDTYKSMSNNAKIAWAILRDRSDLSAKNNWVDEKGYIYFIYTNENLMSILNIGSKATLQKVKKELITAGLLEQERQGLQRANRLYLLNPEVTMEDVYRIDRQEEGIEVDKEKAYKASGSNRSTESELQLSESGSTENELQEVQKVNTNDTDFSETEYKDNKDNKDHETEKINKSFNHSIQKRNQETDNDLIEFMITEERLEWLYGENMVNILRTRSRGNFDLFKEWVDLISYAIGSVEEEEGVSLSMHLYEAEESAFAYEFRNDLVKTMQHVLFKIRTDKFGKIKDQKAYLFTSLKTTAENWANNAKQL